MIKKSTNPPCSIRSSKQTPKSAIKKPITNIISQNPNLVSNNKKRTNSSYIENSNKRKLQQVGYSHKKYNSNSSLNNSKYKVFEVEHLIPVGSAHKSTKNQIQPKVHSSITTNIQHKSISKNKIKKNLPKNESLGQIGYCKKIRLENSKTISSCEAKARKRVPIVDSPPTKQDHLKNELDEYQAARKSLCRDHCNEENKPVKQKGNRVRKLNQQNQRSSQQQQDMSKLADIDIDQIKKIGQMTSQQLSQLQSRSQTIDLLKVTIKTKLQKDIFSQSPQKLNSLLSSYQKAPSQQYIEEIMRLKQLETNFYVQKITVLQAELIRTRKEAERNEREGKIRWQQENKKVLVQKTRLEEENLLLKRQNDALRTIIMKKLKPNSKSTKPSGPVLLNEDANQP